MQPEAQKFFKPIRVTRTPDRTLSRSETPLYEDVTYVHRHLIDGIRPTLEIFNFSIQMIAIVRQQVLNSPTIII